MKTTISKISSDALALIQHLRSVSVGDVVTYQNLEAVVGYDIRERRGALYTALNRLKRDELATFDVIRGVGYKRMNNEEAAGMMGRYIDRSRKEARRGLVTADTVSVHGLPVEKRNTFVAQASVLRLMSDVSSGKSQRALADAATDKNEIVAGMQALDAIKKAFTTTRPDKS